MKAGNKYKVLLICEECNTLYNESSVVNKEIAEKMYDNALFNPLIGWCDGCNNKPSPKILRLRKNWKEKSNDK